MTPAVGSSVSLPAIDSKRELAVTQWAETVRSRWTSDTSRRDTFSAFIRGCDIIQSDELGDRRTVLWSARSYQFQDVLVSSDSLADPISQFVVLFGIRPLLNVIGYASLDSLTGHRFTAFGSEDDERHRRVLLADGF